MISVLMHFYSVIGDIGPIFFLLPNSRKFCYSMKTLKVCHTPTYLNTTVEFCYNHIRIAIGNQEVDQELAR